MGDDGRGAARVNMEGDVSLSAEDLSLDQPYVAPVSKEIPPVPVDHRSPYDDEEEDEEYDEYEEEEPHHSWLGGSTAVKFLLAGGVAGAVSRTCTAPFDRLKIFLITRPPELGGTSLTPQAPVRGLKAIGSAIARIYAEGGILGFWTGNGLSVAKILPESAIKFLAYESSKRFFAKYWDHVEDSRDISGVSRFMSGGIGGITSQLTIYPIETLKTQMMSSAGGQRRTLREAARRVWQLGGIRAFYRGLTIGLIGVFPYSAIDMSTFEALKLAYLRSTGKDEPGVLALLAFGSVSGSVGATSVYPLNLVRTRLQASGSSGHPERYTGILDVVKKTYTRRVAGVASIGVYYLHWRRCVIVSALRIRHSLTGVATRWYLLFPYRDATMEFRPRYAQPFTLEEARQLAVPIITEGEHPSVTEITRLQNSLAHLQRTQEELQEALLATPEDPDFAQAYEENEIVVLSQKERISILRMVLSEKGIPMSAHYDLPARGHGDQTQDAGTGARAAAHSESHSIGGSTTTNGVNHNQDHEPADGAGDVEEGVYL
ncbi:hypothetical protein NUW54_g5063 [Trametes sanguinea]|uniref:Uncharacterized protein n=1 Tax=Trametes sanguinea TaxID=158606 RepID=A0ACC1PXF4_9APHY|nr:hypothetical protein NUW54_g5063 [Trametes sanguinea]